MLISSITDRSCWYLDCDCGSRAPPAPAAAAAAAAWAVAAVEVADRAAAEGEEDTLWFCGKFNG